MSFDNFMFFKESNSSPEMRVYMQPFGNSLDDLMFDMFPIMKESEIIDYFSFDESLVNLENLLQDRPSESSLSERNILKERNVSPILQATQQVIKRKKLAKHIEHKLEHRPELVDLVHHNIIKENEPVKFQESLVMLEHKLDPHHRPQRTVLVENNIIKDGVAPSLQAVQQSLKFRTTSIVLDHKLEHRPQVSYLVEHNILPSLTDMAEYQTDSESEDEKENEDRFHEAAVSLKHKLEKRPSMSQLIDTGILDFDSEVSRILKNCQFSMSNELSMVNEPVFLRLSAEQTLVN